jgi:hypothetical protein
MVEILEAKMTMHISYRTAQALKEFLGKDAPEPMEDLYYYKDPITCRTMLMNNPQEDWILAPAYSLHDLLSREFCEAMGNKLISIRKQWPWREEKFKEICVEIFNEYYDGGLPAVEKAIIEIIRRVK